MIKVLFVREYYSDGDPALGTTDGGYLDATLEYSGMGTACWFFYDTGNVQYGSGNFLEIKSLSSVEERDHGLLEAVRLNRPDVVVFNSLMSWGDFVIKKETWQKVKDIGVRIVGKWHEGVAPDVVRVADLHADVVDLNLFVDTKKQFMRLTRFPEKCIGIYNPSSPDYFMPKVEKKRDIPVFFGGTLCGRSDRCAGIFTLLANHIPVTKVGGRREYVVEDSVWIDLLQRSKIGLNFSDAGEFRHFKGRIVETCLAGAMLMDLANEETSNVLDPMRDYVPFTSQDDLYTKVVYYLEHDDERQEIAKRGQAKALAKLTGQEFWSELFGRLKLI